MLNNPYKHIVNNYQPEKIPMGDSPDSSVMTHHQGKDYSKQQAAATPDLNQIAVRVSVKNKEVERGLAQSALSSIKTSNDYFVDDHPPAKQKRILQQFDVNPTTHYAIPNLGINENLSSGRNSFYNSQSIKEVSKISPKDLKEKIILLKDEQKIFNNEGHSRSSSLTKGLKVKNSLIKGGQLFLEQEQRSSKHARSNSVTHTHQQPSLHNLPFLPGSNASQFHNFIP